MSTANRSGGCDDSRPAAVLRSMQQVFEGEFVAPASTRGQTRPSVTSQEQAGQPPLFKVLMHNDDYTTMEFVVEVLQTVFHKPPTEAGRIMLHIHFKGVG